MSERERENTPILNTIEVTSSHYRSALVTGMACMATQRALVLGVCHTEGALRCVVYGHTEGAMVCGVWPYRGRYGVWCVATQRALRCVVYGHTEGALRCVVYGHAEGARPRCMPH